MVKVANVTMDGRFAGPQARILAVAEKLKENGVETTVVFPQDNSDLFHDALKVKGIPTRRLRLHRLTRQGPDFVRYLIYFLIEVHSLYRLFRTEGFDIVHCNSSWQFKGVIAGKLAGVRVLWHLNDTQMPAAIRIIFRLLGSWFCNAFVTSGERVRGYYLNNTKLRSKEATLIRPPVDTTLFDPHEVRADGRIAGCEGIKIVTVCNVTPLKGLEYFIEMAAILNGRYHGLNFLIVGPLYRSQKRYEKMLSELAEKLKVNNLIFYGSTNNVPSVLKSADIFVCSSITESGPMSVWEAMSMAKPIVSTDVGDVSIFIRDGHNGFVVPVRDAGALAKKVGLLVEDKALRMTFGAIGRAIATHHLDVRICAKRHAECYRKMLDLH